jgi:hypothetical protein
VNTRFYIFHLLLYSFVLAVCAHAENTPHKERAAIQATATVIEPGGYYVPQDSRALARLTEIAPGIQSDQAPLLFRVTENRLAVMTVEFRSGKTEDRTLNSSSESNPESTFPHLTHVALPARSKTVTIWYPGD